MTRHWLTVAVALVGCNAVLDNQEGHGSSEKPLFPPAGEPGDSARSTSDDSDAAVAHAGQSSDAATDTCPPDWRACLGACTPVTDPRYGCGAATCAPCALEHATAKCAGGACAIDTCAAGFADCNASPIDGCETDLSNPVSCGACGIACTTEDLPICQAVGDVFACASGCPVATDLRCHGACTDTTSDPDNCGACGVLCGFFERCRGGVCGF